MWQNSCQNGGICCGLGQRFFYRRISPGGILTRVRLHLSKIDIFSAVYSSAIAKTCVDKRHGRGNRGFICEPHDSVRGKRSTDLRINSGSRFLAHLLRIRAALFFQAYLARSDSPICPRDLRGKQPQAPPWLLWSIFLPSKRCSRHVAKQLPKWWDLLRVRAALFLSAYFARWHFNAG